VKKYVMGYEGWSKLFENESDSDLEQRINDLRGLIRFGFAEKSELDALLRKSKSSVIINEMPDVKRILSGPEYRELQEKGIELVSSKTQLLNGTLVFGQPDYNRNTDYAIGIFPTVKTIRRMTPKGIYTGVRGRSPYGIGSMDFRIKDLSFVADDQFYQVAIRWMLDHIDLEDPQFPVKTRTRRDYFNNR
jgi:hypothetical protein